MREALVVRVAADDAQLEAAVVVVRDGLHALDEDGEVVVEHAVELRHRRRAATCIWRWRIGLSGHDHSLNQSISTWALAFIDETMYPLTRNKGTNLVSLYTIDEENMTLKAMGRPRTSNHAYDVKRAQSVINFLPFLLRRPTEKNRPLFCRRNDGFPTNE